MTFKKYYIYTIHTFPNLFFVCWIWFDTFLHNVVWIFLLTSLNHCIIIILYFFAQVSLSAL